MSDEKIMITGLLGTVLGGISVICEYHAYKKWNIVEQHTDAVTLAVVGVILLFVTLMIIVGMVPGLSYDPTDGASSIVALIAYTLMGGLVLYGFYGLTWFFKHMKPLPGKELSTSE